MSRAPSRILLSALLLAFVASGLVFIPRLGIEVDEAIVASGIYPHGDAWYSWHLGQDEIPVMLISYLGALKTWMYNAIFLVFPPGAMSLRLPTLLLGAATLWIFFRFLERSIGSAPAWIATLLLATDSSYLLMNTVDYGPVTFHFVFKLAALLLLVRFHQQGGQGRSLEAAFFLIGLALWDKAIFGWSLIGLVAAGLVLFHKEIFSHVNPRNLMRAGAATILGALPLVIYNIARPLETLSRNVDVEQVAVLGKSVILTRAMEGSVLFGFMTAPDVPPAPLTDPGRWFQSLSMGLADLLGHPQSNLTLWAAGATLLALPLLWRTPARKPVLFGLIASIGTWIPMVLTAGAGAAAQHVLMIWPFHLMAIGAAIAQLPLRAAIGITVLLCGANLAVTNEYYAELLQAGASQRWTDAMDPLYEHLSTYEPEPGTRPRIWVADWGIIETMNLLGEGRLDISLADLSGDQGLHNMMDDPRSIFVAHAAGQAIHPEERGALDEFARREGYIEEPVTTIYDRYGRPTFDVFRFRQP